MNTFEKIIFYPIYFLMAILVMLGIGWISLPGFNNFFWRPFFDDLIATFVWMVINVSYIMVASRTIWKKMTPNA